MKKFYRELYQERNTINIDQSLLMFQWGLTVLFFPLGGILGSLLVGPLVDGSGRKGTLLASSVMVIVSAVLMGCSKAIHSHEFIILGRLIVGTCAGISFSVVPMYLTEMAPRNLRGTVGSVPYIFTVCGSLVAHLLSLPKLLGTEEGWPVLLSLTGVPALFEVATLPFFPESPRFLLIQRQDMQRARQVLKQLRGWDDVEDELEELRQEDLAESTEKKMDVLKMLRCEELRWHLVTIVVLMAGQQLSGINAAQYYTERIYLSTGVGDNEVWYLRLFLLVLLMSVALLVTRVIDSSGRRMLLLVGNGVCGSACILTAMSVELQNNIRWMSYFSSSFDTLLLVGHSIGPGKSSEDAQGSTAGV
ncbi:solute carrier family 2, facilitated glucose transporter member 5-like [Varanus komodoensis]|uniref:solute carrier family 2, facilitated glucose transporter member 5-like n=1 Tax=Varanus komodoensis TaxID=61221 RepID=UPI001CF7A5D4|nr:solute carrier family 2, facilitated glucose transporter member 5-like [Varanus komodoensis]